MKPRAKPRGRPDPIGQRIKDLRVARGLTLQELADKVGVAPSHIFHVESGDKVPSEDLAVKLARTLRDDEDLYRAWARARSRSDFYTAVESAGILAEYMRSAKQAMEGESGRREATQEQWEQSSVDPSVGRGVTQEQWERPEVLYGAMDEQRISSLQMLFSQKIAMPSPARLLIPMVAAGEDPGQAPAPSQVLEVLRLDPRALDPAEPLERPFAYPLTGPTMKRVEGLLPDRGVAIFTRRVLPVVPHEIYAVRHEGHVVLSRALWNGRELLLLPAPGASDFIVLPAASEADVATLIVGRVAVVRAEP